MIDLGFEPQVNEIFEKMSARNMRPINNEQCEKDCMYRQTFIFGTTMSIEMKRMIKKYLHNPVYIIIGDKLVDEVYGYIDICPRIRKFIDRPQKFHDKKTHEICLMFVTCFGGLIQRMKQLIDGCLEPPQIDFLYNELKLTSNNTNIIGEDVNDINSYQPEQERKRRKLERGYGGKNYEQIKSPPDDIICHSNGRNTSKNRSTARKRKFDEMNE